MEENTVALNFGSDTDRKLKQLETKFEEFKKQVSLRLRLFDSPATTNPLGAEAGNQLQRSGGTIYLGGTQPNLQMLLLGPADTATGWIGVSPPELGYYYGAQFGLVYVGTIGSGALLSDATLTLSNTQVLGVRKTGWGTPTGTYTRTTFNSGTVTLSQLAERVAALIDDLSQHGMIGA